MRMKSIVFTFVSSVALSGGLAIPSAAHAQEYRGTMQQQMACTPDVWRLCSAQIPDVNRIVACLRQNAAYLSDDCRAVLRSSNADQPQQPPPRGRPLRPGTPTPPPPRDNDWIR
jgi:hypothetical protein